MEQRLIHVKALRFFINVCVTLVGRLVNEQRTNSHKIPYIVA